MDDKGLQRLEQEGRARQIVGLDVLRFAAATLVLLYHLCFYDWTPRAGRAQPLPHTFDALRPLLSSGWVAVDIFFVISGYVIAFSASRASAGAFLSSRVLRLVPTALLCATLSATIMVWRAGMAPSVTLALWARSVLFQPAPTIDPSYWTMTVEVSFYGLVLLLLLFRGFRLLPLCIGAVGLVGTYYACMMAVLRWLSAHVVDLLYLPLHRVAMDVRTLVTYGPSFAVGVLLWFSLHERWTHLRTAVLGVCAMGSVAGILMRGNTLARESGVHFVAAVPVVLWLLSVAGLVCAVHWNDRVHRLVGRRGVGVSRVAGLCTYPLYLLHHAIGAELVLWWMHSVGVFAATVAAIAVIAGLTWTVTWWLEPPFRNWLRQIFARFSVHTTSQIFGVRT